MHLACVNWLELEFKFISWNELSQINFWRRFSGRIPHWRATKDVSRRLSRTKVKNDQADAVMSRSSLAAALTTDRTDRETWAEPK